MSAPVSDEQPDGLAGFLTRTSFHIIFSVALRRVCTYRPPLSNLSLVPKVPP